MRIAHPPAVSQIRRGSAQPRTFGEGREVAPEADAVKEVPDKRIGCELADQLRLCGEIGQEESEKGSENAQEKKRGQKDEKPGENVFKKQQQPTHGRDARREDTFNFKVLLI